MASFCSLPDLVLLEIFSFLSCEDALSAFAELNNNRLTSLLVERGAFHHIHLSSALSIRQYDELKQRIWRFDCILSLIVEDVFAERLYCYTPHCQFPLLAKLHLLHPRHISLSTQLFVGSHAFTLTHLTLTPPEQTYPVDEHIKFFHEVLPELTQLTVLNTSLLSEAQIGWALLPDGIQSLQHLTTFAEHMSDVYILAVRGILPHLRSLCVRLCPFSKTVVPWPIPGVASLHLPDLERLSLFLIGQQTIEWSSIEVLTCLAVMPRLRHCALDYDLKVASDIRRIFASPLFGNDERHVRVRFRLHVNEKIVGLSSSSDDLSTVRSGRYREIYCEYSGNMIHPGGRMWFTPSWPRHAVWMIHNNGRDHSCAPSGAKSISVSAPSTSLHRLVEQVPVAHSLYFERPGSFLIDSPSAPAPLVHVKKLTLQHVTPGVELLLDGAILPNLRHIQSCILPLSVAFISRRNQLRSMDEIDRLVLVEDEVDTFALKHWQIALDTVPRLQSLIISFGSVTCPPIRLADMLIDYVIRAAEQRLGLFSFRFMNDHDQLRKLQFIERIEEEFRSLLWMCHIKPLDEFTIDLWMY